MGYYDQRGGRAPYRGNNNYDQRGYYPNNRGFNERSQYSDPGYGRGGYDDRPQNNGKYNIGDVLNVIGHGITVHVVRIGREQYECRLPDLRTEWFYEHELEPVQE